MNDMKGQAALDFLMTYGWAIVLVVLVAGALFALGVFNTGSFVGSKASGFTQVAVKAWKVTSAGAITMKVQNQVGAPISIRYINATYTNSTVSYTTATSLANGDTSNTLTIGTLGTAPSSGASYTLTVKIGYTDTEQSFDYVDAGTLTGTAE